MPRADLVRGCGTLVLAADVEHVVAGRGHELDKVGRYGAHVVAEAWVRRVTDAAHVGHDAGVVGGLGRAGLCASSRMSWGMPCWRRRGGPETAV